MAKPSPQWLCQLTNILASEEPFQAFERIYEDYYDYESFELRVCPRRLLRLAAVVVFIGVLLVSGCLYARIISHWKGDKKRVNRVTAAFLCVWGFWAVQTAPFLLFDLYDFSKVALFHSHLGLGISVYSTIHKSAHVRATIAPIFQFNKNSLISRGRP